MTKIVLSIDVYIYQEIPRLGLNPVILPVGPLSKLILFEKLPVWILENSMLRLLTNFINLFIGTIDQLGIVLNG